MLIRIWSICNRHSFKIISFKFNQILVFIYDFILQNFVNEKRINAVELFCSVADQISFEYMPFELLR